MIDDTGFKISGDVRLRFGCTKIEVEEPVELRAGLYDVGRIGAFTFLGGDGSVIRNVESIGRFCMIGPGSQFGLVEHPGEHLSAHVAFEHNSTKQFPFSQTRDYWERNKFLVTAAREAWASKRSSAKIRIGDDVWIGQGVTIARGVTIGDGAIIASKAVVTKNVEPYSIVGGIPAKLIKWRFPLTVRKKLLELQWWRYGLNAMHGVDVKNPMAGVFQIERNIRKLDGPYIGRKLMVTEASAKALRV